MTPKPARFPRVLPSQIVAFRGGLSLVLDGVATEEKVRVLSQRAWNLRARSRVPPHEGVFRAASQCLEEAALAAGKLLDLWEDYQELQTSLPDLFPALPTYPLQVIRAKRLDLPLDCTFAHLARLITQEVEDPPS